MRLKSTINCCGGEVSRLTFLCVARSKLKLASDHAALATHDPVFRVGPPGAKGIEHYREVPPAGNATGMRAYSKCLLNGGSDQHQP
jgi:hypothetical protein